MTNTRPYQITAELLSALQTEGYALGVDKHLQIQTLLNKLPDDLTDEALKCALIPLLAQSPAEQDQLYGVFDDCVKRVNELPIEITPSVKDDENTSTFPKVGNFWKGIIALAVVLLLSIGGYFLYKKLNPEPQKQTTVEAPTNANPNENITQTTQQTKSNTEASPFVENKPYPFPNHLDDYDIEVSPTQQWLSENWAWLRWILALTLTVLLVALWRYRAWKRQKLIAQQDPNEKPPYFWNIHIEGADDFLVADNVDYAAQLMRRRADADAFRLDLPRTIQATVERGGMPAFRFKKQTTPSEYLLLIDRQSVRNHRARLFDKLYEAFKAQEVEIARYFYDSDLRTCYDEAHPYGISLADVQQRHYQARLIVVGTGAQLLNPLSNKPAAWTAVFEQWKNRALLTPKPLKSWGYDERQLSTLFTALPATLQGLGFWVEELELGDDARFETWTEKVHDAPNAPIQPDAVDPMPMLQLYFDLPMLEWIAACAIYPTLHWDLTLWLAQQLSPPAPEGGERGGTSLPLGGWGGMTQLNRLSWFVAGEMPNETRAALLNWLETYKPDLLQKLRLALALELQKNPPPADSVAYEPFRMTVAVNEWLATDDTERKKELETEIAQLLAKGAEPDFTVIKYLEKPRTALDFVVPDAWKKYVFPSGFPALGWLKEWKDLWWIGVLWLVGLVACFYPYHFTACKEVVSLDSEGKTYRFCHTDPLSAMVYHEELQHGFIKNKKFSDTADLTFRIPSNITDSSVAADLLLGDLLFENIDTKDTSIINLAKECRQNIAVDFYRLANEYYKKGQKDSTCLYLDVAAKFDSLDTNIQAIQVFLCGKANKKVQLSVASKNEGKVIKNSPIFFEDDKNLNLINSNIDSIRNKNKIVIIWESPYKSINFTTVEKNFRLKIRVLSEIKLEANDFSFLNNDRKNNLNINLLEPTSYSDKKIFNYSVAFDIELLEGYNIIRVNIKDVTDEISINYVPNKPSLHIFSIGIPGDNLKYTTKDASDFVSAFNQQQNTIYSNIHINLQNTTEKTTKNEILRTFNEIRRKYRSGDVGSNDFIMIFISGHGFSHDGEFYFAGSDFSRTLLSTYISYTEDISRMLADVKCQKLILIDACSSTSNTSNGKGLVFNQRALPKPKYEFNQEEQSCFIIASSSGEAAYENAIWENGAFTEALLEAFNNKSFVTREGIVNADTNKDKFLSIDELYDFVRKRTPLLLQQAGIKGSQTPATNNCERERIFFKL